MNKSLNGGDKKSESKNSSTPIPKENKIDVRAKLAKVAGVSTDTYTKGKKILNSDNEKLKKEVLSGKTSRIIFTETDTFQREMILESGNIRRRGEIGGSAKKVGKRIKELERLYGIQNGGDRKSEPNSSVLKKSQSDIAAQMGISVDTLQNYKMLSEMIPELSDLVDTGIVTKI